MVIFINKTYNVLSNFKQNIFKSMFEIIRVIQNILSSRLINFTGGSIK